MDLRIGTESHTCEESVPNPRACEESVPNPHAFYVKNRYQIITDVKNCYELFTYVSDRPPLDELTGMSLSDEVKKS